MGAYSAPRHSARRVRRPARHTATRSDSERFVVRQVAPLPRRQRTERHAAHTHAFEADYFQTDQLAHAPDLTFLAFTQHEAQLFAVLPANLGRLERHVVEFQTVTQQLKAFEGEVLVDLGRHVAVGHAHQI